MTCSSLTLRSLLAQVVMVAGCAGMWVVPVLAGDSSVQGEILEGKAANAEAPAPAAAATSSGGAAQNLSLPGVQMTEAKTTDLMGQGTACMQRQHQKIGELCCKECPGKCCPGYWGEKFFISFWEPSAVIEVSCRTGYSMLAPGAVPTRGGGDKTIQSCQGFNKPGNSKWFFEARVWAIDGYNGGLRHQAMGGTVGQQMRQCQDVGDDTYNKEYWGYARTKWNKFKGNRGAANGPGGSWEAYISDGDKSWATDDGGVKSAPQQKACKIGGVDIANCWGPMTDSGWIDHPNPKVAAALVAWRAHEKARKMNKVSPPAKGGYKMMMDYPFVSYSGPFGGSMGAPNGGKTGSQCFQPGDSGPAWFGGKEPLSIPDFVKGLKPGDVTTVAEVNPGVYIFTVWVYSACIRYKIPAHNPGTKCFYQDISGS